MALESIIKNLDIRNIKSPSGLTYMAELANAANTLRNCIQSRINHETMGNCISAADIADVKVNGLSLSVTLKVQGSIRPSIFKQWNGKDANVFWLLNDGFIVKNTRAFARFAHPERWIVRIAEHFVEEGIAAFNSSNHLGISVEVKRPLFYYG